MELARCRQELEGAAEQWQQWAAVMSSAHNEQQKGLLSVAAAAAAAVGRVGETDPKLLRLTAVG